MADSNIEIKFSTQGAEGVASAIEGTAKKLKKLSSAGAPSQFSATTPRNIERLGASSAAASVGVGKLGAASGIASRGVSFLGSVARTAVSTIVGLAASAGVSVAGLKMAFDRAAALHKQANALGEDAGRVRLLGQAFAENGLAAEQVLPMVTKMQRKIEQTPDVFAALGLDASSLKGKSAVEQMSAIGDAVRAVTSQEAKMSALMKIFEEAGPQLMQFFNNPKALEDASRTLGSSIGIMSANAAAFERASTLIGNVATKVGTFFDGVASGVVEPLNSLLEALNGIDLAAKGEAFGGAIRSAVELFYAALSNDQLFELVGVKLSAALSKAGSSLWNSMLDAGTTASAALFSGVEALFDAGNGKGFSRNFADAMRRNTASAERSDVMKFARSTDAIAKEWASLESRLEASLRAVSSGLYKQSDGSSAFAKAAAPVASVVAPKMENASASASSTARADARARIGGFIGGGASASLTAASQRTARNTERMAASLDALARRISVAPSGSSVAVYAS